MHYLYYHTIFRPLLQAPEECFYQRIVNNIHFLVQKMLHKGNLNCEFPLYSNYLYIEYIHV